MYLDETSIRDTKKVAKINRFLKENYGFTLNSDVDLKTLLSSYRSINNVLSDLKIKEYTLHTNPEYIKNLLMLEGIKFMISSRKQKLNEATVIISDKNYELGDGYQKVIGWLCDFCKGCIKLGDSVEDAVSDAMKQYRSSKYRYPDEYVRDDLTKQLYALFNGNAITPEPLLLNSAKVEEMKKDLIKSVRMLMENEVEQAEVLVAAKSFSQELQGMIEKIGRLQSEDLGPVTDQMRDSYGSEYAQAFNKLMYDNLENITTTLRDTKESIDSTVDQLAANQIPGAMNSMASDMSTEPLPDLDVPGGELGGELGGEPAGDLEMGADLGEPSLEDPLGRAKKESLMRLHKKLVETQLKIKKLKSAQKKR